MDVTLLDSPFEIYMQYRKSYFFECLNKSPGHSAVIGSILDSGGLPFFEAQWSKEYWFHQCAKLSVGG